jgi:uncharacterized protein YbjT (DUF2867 family)
MIVTVIGSTGLTGSFLVRQLLVDSAITKVVSVSRKSLNISNATLTEVPVSDLAALPSIQSEIRGDLYFCCLGTTIKAAGSRENFQKVDHDAVVAFAKIAKSHDATSFTLVSAMGANTNSMFFYNEMKGRTENDVETLGLRSLIIFRPALLVGPRAEFRWGGKARERDAATTFTVASESNSQEPHHQGRNPGNADVGRGKSGASGYSRHSGKRYLAIALPSKSYSKNPCVWQVCTIPSRLSAPTLCFIRYK